MLFVLMTMILDGVASPAGLTSVSATVNGSLLRVQGTYERGETTPLLVWPRKDTWHNPCRMATDLCCVRELLLEYRNDELQRQQGPRCITTLKGDLIAGSRPDVLASNNNFSALVPIDTPFVAMLFLHTDPFYTLDSVQTFNLRANGAVDVRAVVQNNPCHNVEVPGRPFKVCMHCNNVIRSNAHFVWTPTWYIDNVCYWKCDDGFETGTMGTHCSLMATPIIPMQTMAYGICGVVVVVLGLGLLFQKPAKLVADTETPPPLECGKHEIIQFREISITPMHIRVKMN